MTLELTSLQKTFITRWGEMGYRWGVNRTVAQVHALLFIAAVPLDAAVITETLSIARSNISVALRELESWGLIKVVHVLGDRKDHFEANGDVWEMFRAIVNQRKAREFDPLLETARACLGSSKSGSESVKRLENLVELLEISESFFTALNTLPLSMLKKLMKGGARLQGFLK